MTLYVAIFKLLNEMSYMVQRVFWKNCYFFFNLLFWKRSGCLWLVMFFTFIKKVPLAINTQNSVVSMQQQPRTKIFSKLLQGTVNFCSPGIKKRLCYTDSISVPVLLPLVSLVLPCPFYCCPLHYFVWYCTALHFTVLHWFKLRVSKSCRRADSCLQNFFENPRSAG